MILLLAQNGYKIKHFILDSAQEKITDLNDYYHKFELTKNSTKKLTKLVEDSTLIIINDYDNFEKYYNLDQLVKNKKNEFPIIMNQKFEVFIQNLNCFYTIFDDKQMLAFSGILSAFRPYHEYIPPFVPTVNIFEMFLKGIFIGTFVNFAILNKLKNNNILEIINKGFLNLIYFYFNFFKNFLKNYSEEMDKGESIFPREHYNFIKTKDGKHISIGNLETRFQDNFKKEVEKINVNDYVERSGVDFDEEVPKKFTYDFDSVSKVFSHHNRDELFVKVISSSNNYNYI